MQCDEEYWQNAQHGDITHCVDPEFFKLISEAMARPAQLVLSERRTTYGSSLPLAPHEDKRRRNRANRPHQSNGDAKQHIFP